ncbi:MAG TPA: zf-HC2 domain-containing protein [Candidatus Dormibacteraeota bacterium]|nr:zf-HC2 domain-containing protein [Candidatus Dormibacteraeota bacterium]
MAAICVWVREQLEPLIDGDLAPARVDELRGHLAACEACREHYAEASSLPTRLAVVRTPEPPLNLVRDVLRRVRGDRVGPMRLWGPLGLELVLFLITLWYMSGFGGLYLLVQRTAADAGAVLGWDLGQANLPPPAAGDLFLLLLCGLLVATTLYHLTLLARLGLRLS